VRTPSRVGSCFCLVRREARGEVGGNNPTESESEGGTMLPCAREKTKMAVRVFVERRRGAAIV
jgi:hypothetical protein